MVGGWHPTKNSYSTLIVNCALTKDTDESWAEVEPNYEHFEQSFQEFIPRCFVPFSDDQGEKAPAQTTSPVEPVEEAGGATHQRIRSSGNKAAMQMTRTETRKSKTTKTPVPDAPPAQAPSVSNTTLQPPIPRPAQPPAACNTPLTQPPAAPSVAQMQPLTLQTPSAPSALSMQAPSTSDAPPTQPPSAPGVVQPLISLTPSSPDVPSQTSSAPTAPPTQTSLMADMLVIPRRRLPHLTRICRALSQRVLRQAPSSVHRILDPESLMKAGRHLDKQMVAKKWRIEKKQELVMSLIQPWYLNFRTDEDTTWWEPRQELSTTGSPPATDFPLAMVPPSDNVPPDSQLATPSVLPPTSPASVMPSSPATLDLSPSTLLSSNASPSLAHEVFPEWVTTASPYLKDSCRNAAWQTIVASWLDFDKQMGFKSTRRITVESRPQPVTWWITRGRKYSDNKMPTIDLPGYGEDWKRWWIGMQPAWRRAQGARGGWDALLIEGPNGMFIPLIAAAWWLRVMSIKDVDKPELLSELGWVLDTLVIYRSWKRRSPSSGLPEEPPSKRAKA
ncbi:hypothetical protein C8Q80DRAFT_1270225 [Daedaleopsis nitida]|nr:hypothetical protein C8Q80DRAFT_1270225 [Daedaleopsis nitida]